MTTDTAIENTDTEAAPWDPTGENLEALKNRAEYWFEEATKFKNEMEKAKQRIEYLEDECRAERAKSSEVRELILEAFARITRECLDR